MQAWDLVQWLDYLKSLHHKDIDMGLTRIKQVYQVLKLNFSHATVVTVAGTNGKGSTCAVLEQAGIEANRTTGLYSSPQLVRYSEVVRINGKELSERAHCEAFLTVEKARGDTPLTYFEFGTLAALYLLASNGCDLVLLESYVREGYPLVIARPDGTFTTVESMSHGRLEAAKIDHRMAPYSMTRRELTRLVASEPAPRLFVAKKQLDLDSVSESPYHADLLHHHGHLSPLRRFLGLLRLELRDIWTVIVFALVAGILALATPLAVESLVNVVSWGTYLQPLVVLGLVLMTCLAIAGVLRVLQKFTVELIQRRQFVRIVSDLAHRFPRANQNSIAQEFPRELANRVFDVMTIQKATAILLAGRRVDHLDDHVGHVAALVLSPVSAGIQHCPARLHDIDHLVAGTRRNPYRYR